MKCGDLKEGFARVIRVKRKEDASAPLCDLLGPEDRSAGGPLDTRVPGGIVLSGLPCNVHPSPYLRQWTGAGPAIRLAPPLEPSIHLAACAVGQRVGEAGCGSRFSEIQAGMSCGTLPMLRQTGGGY